MCLGIFVKLANGADSTETEGSRLVIWTYYNCFGVFGLANKLEMISL